MILKGLIDEVRGYGRMERCCSFVGLCIHGTGPHLNDYGFRDQITRSGLSISSNIAEGFGRSTDKDKRNFLNYARGSCAEFRSQTYIGIKAGFIDQVVGSSWVNESNTISAMLTRLMSYLSKKKPDERPMTNYE